MCFLLILLLKSIVRLCPGLPHFCCYLKIVGGGVSPDVWPELSDAPGGLTDSRGLVHEASSPAFQKDALLSSKLNKPSPPSSSHNTGQTEVSKVSETVQEELTPSPEKAAPKGKSKSEPLKKKKDLGESRPSQTITSVSILSSSLVVQMPSFICVCSHQC